MRSTLRQPCRAAVADLLVTADVVLRYVFNAPLSWGLEVSSHLLLLFFLLGLAQSFRAGDHISMELVAAHIPRRAAA